MVVVLVVFFWRWGPVVAEQSAACVDRSQVMELEMNATDTHDTHVSPPSRRIGKSPLGGQWGLSHPTMDFNCEGFVMMCV